MRNAPTLALLAALLANSAALAADSDDPAARAKAALRAATIHARELEDQNASLQAKAAAADQAKQELAAKLDADEKELAALRKSVDDGKAALDKTNADLKAQQDNTAKWQSSYQEAAEAARKRDADAKALDVVLGRIRGRVKICEEKNGDLYKLSEEVLGLYDKRGLLDAVASSEPLTKIKRVEIENLMQDYEDKFRADKIDAPQ